MKAWDDFKASSPIVQIIIAFMVIFVVVGLLCTCIFVFRMFTGTSELVNRLEHGMVFVTPTTSSAPAEPEEPAAPPAIEPTPTPIIFTDWRGEYFDNPNLEGEPVLVRIFGTLAIILATMNVVGGFLVTHRMLGMFRKKG